jgi:hypothetical protein
LLAPGALTTRFTSSWSGNLSWPRFVVAALFERAKGWLAQRQPFVVLAGFFTSSCPTRRTSGRTYLHLPRATAGADWYDVRLPSLAAGNGSAFGYCSMLIVQARDRSGATARAPDGWRRAFATIFPRSAIFLGRLCASNSWEVVTDPGSAVC